MFGKFRDIFRTILERDRLQCDHVETEIEIFAKLAGAYHLCQVPIRCGDKTNVNGYFLVAAQGRDGPLLKDPEQLGLEFVFQFANLVQKERAAVGCAKQPSAAFSAPVKAPLTCPNMWPAKRSPLTAAQSTGIKGF